MAKPEQNSNEHRIAIEVVYPLPQEQLLFNVLVTEESTVREGIIASGVLERYPELNLEQLKVGIFGKLTPLNTPLRAKDRVEIYRPLIADPKAVRKERAAAGKRMKKGGGDMESAD
ncbi:MAG: RnfH family protein [Thiolinea sp.]